jgi:hypothetical protein
MNDEDDVDAALSLDLALLGERVRAAENERDEK